MKDKGIFGSLTAVDIALTAGLSVIIGLMFTVLSNFVGPAISVLGPLSSPLIYGLWFLGGVIPAYIIRKPGIAFLGEFIAALVSVLTGSQYGWIVVLYGATQGLASEIAFMLFMYKRWDVLAVGLSGALAAIPAIFLDTYLYGSYLDLSIWLRLIAFIVTFISGAFFAIVLGKWVSDKLAATGILNNFRISVKS